MISSFNQINLTENSLLFLDVDETVIFYPKMKKDWWKNTCDAHFEITNDRNIFNKITKEIWTNIILTEDFFCTDIDGLHSMLEKCKLLNVKTIFLTKRENIHHGHTFEQLLLLNISCNSNDLF